MQLTFRDWDGEPKECGSDSIIKEKLGTEALYCCPTCGIKTGDNYKNLCQSCSNTSEGSKIDFKNEPDLIIDIPESMDFEVFLIAEDQKGESNL